jgi:F420-dependent oxidoreductase-like protein
MRFVIWIGTEQSWDDIAKTAELAVASGWDGIYVADHFMPNEQPAGLGPRLEAWTLLGALAAVTERVRLGVLVTGNTYRHPAILANMAATTDRISDGRVVLGLGAGWQVSEHQAYGIDLYEPAERLRRFEEACKVVRLLLTEERADFDGRYYRLTDAPCEPKPVQARLPLLLGTSGEKVGMRIAAEQADIWNCWGTPETMANKLRILDAHCEKVGRDPKTLERSTQALVRMSTDPEVLADWRQQASYPAIIGTPAEISDNLGEYQRLGLDEFVVSDRVLGRDTREIRDVMQQFIEEVAAPVRN